MNSEEVHRVHAVHWNAGGAGKLFTVDPLPLAHKHQATGLRFTFVLFGQMELLCSPGVKVTGIWWSQCQETGDVVVVVILFSLASLWPFL